MDMEGSGRADKNRSKTSKPLVTRWFHNVSKITPSVSVIPTTVTHFSISIHCNHAHSVLHVVAISYSIRYSSMFTSVPPSVIAGAFVTGHKAEVAGEI